MSLAYVDPAAAGNSSAMVGAAHWLEGLLHGPAITTIAVLAVAATGLSMLSGRIPVRRGLTTALGCFLLFGASTIARGIAMATAGAPTVVTLPPQQLESNPVPSWQPTPPQAAPVVANPYDPYAGAAVIR